MQSPINQSPQTAGPGSSHLQPHRGHVVLILGIMGIAASALCIPAILACIFGYSDLKQIKAGIIDPKGESLTRVGYVCGIIGLCLSALTIIAIIASLIFMLLPALQQVEDMNSRYLTTGDSVVDFSVPGLA